MVITIDGYAGTGKSEAASRLAESLGYELLNTGAMYRATGVVLLRHGIDIYGEQPDHAAIEQLVAGFKFDMPPGHVWLNGEDMTKSVQSEDAGTAASKVGTFLAVRRKLQEEQRRIADARNIVCEGRDQGTVVFPNAEVKFFLKASVAVRAHRRMTQLRDQHQPANYDEVAERIAQRDHQDETRKIDPLRKADGAETIDTTELTRDDVLFHMLAVVKQCLSRG